MERLIVPTSAVSKLTVYPTWASPGLVNAEVIIHEKLTDDRLIDALSLNRVYVPSIIAVNKVDLMSKAQQKKLQSKYPEALFISADKGIGLEGLKAVFWQKLEFKRIYLKKPGKDPDFKEPLVMRGAVTVKRVIKKLKKVVAGLASAHNCRVKHYAGLSSANDLD